MTTSNGIDFFISYTAADRSWAEWIAWQLEAAGYTVILQAWDFEAAENFVARMRDVLEEAKHTLALISRAYLASPYCTSEWTAAFLMDPSGSHRLLQVRIEDCEIPRLLRTRIYIDLVGLSGDDARSRLLAEVKTGLRKKPTTEPPFPQSRMVDSGPSFPGNTLHATNLPPRNAAFAGRGTELRALHNMLRNGAAAVVQSTTVHGLGGVGKTQLVKEYAYRYAADFDVIWWVPAELPVAIPGFLAGLAKAIGLPDYADPSDLLANLWQELRKLNRWLLIFDNAENYRELSPFLPPGGEGVVLISSRSPTWGTFATVKLDVLRRAESIKFLRRRIKDSDAASLDALAAILGDLPLAMEQACAYVQETKISPDEYIELFQEHGNELLALGEPITTEQTISTTWKLAIEKVNIDEPGALDLLLLCAFLAPDDIPRSLIREFSGVLPQPLNNRIVDPLAYNSLVRAVSRYSLVNVTVDSLAVHRLVQVVVRNSVEESSLIKWVSAAVRLVFSAFPKDSGDITTWSACAPLLPHALAVVNFAEPINAEPETTSKLLKMVGIYLWARAELEPAEDMHRRAIALDEVRLGPRDINVATDLNDLGLVLWDLGKFNEAREVHERALEIRRVQLGDDHVDVGGSFNNLGAVLADLGHFSEARNAHERALRIWEQQLSPGHPAVAVSLSNLGLALIELGEPSRSQAVLERALTIWERYVESTGGGSETERSLGRLFSELGNLAGMRAEYERSLQRRWAEVPQSAARPAMLDFNSEAFTSHERQFESVSGQMGSYHPLVATTMDNFGVALAKNGHHLAARRMVELAMGMREAGLGPDHPDVAWSLSNLGAVLAGLGHLYEARDVLERSLAIRGARLGSDHPDVANSLNNLGTVLAQLGASAQARQLLAQALAIRERRLGREHPWTARIRENLSLVSGGV